tara:strand:+ start:489 stop:695 length:207 start_codon:yes stop_codon:yes gene_type:complete
MRSTNYLTILDHSSGKVWQIDMEEVDGFDYDWSTSAFENYITEDLKFRLDEIDYMLHADEDIRRNRDI